MKTNPDDAAFRDTLDIFSHPTLGHGLTKREYFAAMAMQGFLSNSGCREDFTRSQMIEMAVKDADALIADLNK